MAVVLNSFMSRTGSRLMAVMVMVLLAMLATGCQSPKSGSGLETQQVVIAGQTFTLELALDDATRFQGLSDRKEIPRQGGMLFVFPSARQLNFVMRRCLVPIDLIYLGPGGRIVSMHKMEVEPYDTPEHQLKYYSSGWPAQFVIELREGSIDRLGLEVGQKIELPLSDLKAAAK